MNLEDLRPTRTGDVNPLLRTPRFLHRNADTSSGGRSALTPGQRGGVFLPRQVAAPHGGALESWRELHGFVLLEGLCQGRHHHVGDTADRLSVERAGHARYEARGCPRGASFSW